MLERKLPVPGTTRAVVSIVAGSAACPQTEIEPPCSAPQLASWLAALGLQLLFCFYSPALCLTRVHFKGDEAKKELAAAPRTGQ